MAHLLEHLLFSLLFTAWECNAQLSSSQGNFTFCPRDSVTLTCSLSGTVHVWQISGNAATFTLVPAAVTTASTEDGNIMFAISSVDSGTITSTMTFTASVSVINNGTVVSCSNAAVQPRTTLSRTLHIFGTVSPPHMPTLTRARGDYTSLTLSFQQPLYGHECVIEYRVSGPNTMEQTATQSMLIPGLNLCRMVYSFSLFAQTITGNGTAVTVTSSVPDFSDLGRVSNLSISADKSLLQWNPPPNAPDGCISGYTIQWPGNSVTITGSVNSVEVSFLIRESNNELPFCVDVLITVTPSVAVVASPLVSSQNDPPVLLVYQDPDFPSPSVRLGGSGAGLDTRVSWQGLSSSPYSENINVTAGIKQGQQCQATLTDGISQVFPHECSASATVVEFCVVFAYQQCEKMNVSSRQLPSLFSSAVTVSKTSNTIKLEFGLRDISGERCNVSGLRIVYTLFQNNVLMDSNNGTYSSGRNEFTFSSLAWSTSYSYQINVTQGNSVIASYSGQAQTNIAVAIIVVPVLVGILIIAVVIIILIVVVVLHYIMKRNKRIGSKKESDSATHQFMQAKDNSNRIMSTSSDDPKPDVSDADGKTTSKV